MQAFLLSAALTATLAISATAANASANAMTTDWQRVDCVKTDATLAAVGSSSQVCRTRRRTICEPPSRPGGYKFCRHVTERYCFQRPQIDPRSPFGKPKVSGRSRFQNR